MKKTSSRSYLFALRPHFLPVLVWLGAVAAVVAMFHHRSQRFEVIGIARGQVRQIAANCTGRLKSVPVQLFEKVSVGDTVAVVDTILDNEHLETELATISAEIEHLIAQLVPAQDSLIAEKTDRETNRIADRRRFSVDVENARLEILRLRALLASDRITLEDLAMEVKINQDLLKEGAVAPYELQKAQVQYETLAKKIEENEHLLEQADADLKQSLRRRDEYVQYQPHHPSVDNTLEVTRKAIKVQEQRMEELFVRLDPLELKSPIDGVVIQIQARANEARLHRPGENVLRRPGEVVRPGESILAVAEVKPSEIIAYVGENQLSQFREGIAVELVRRTELAKIQIARSQVTYVGPTIEIMPERLWRNPNIPLWGRPILIEVPQGLDLILGELVGVRIL